MRRLFLAAPLIVVAAACTTDSADYKNQTQDYLDDSSAVEDVYGGADVSGADCEEPADTEVGTRYVCTAEVDGVGTVTFDAEIDGENSYVVAPRP